MTKLALVFTICTIIFIVINSAVSQAEEEGSNGQLRSENQPEDDERFDRSSLPGYALANANVLATGNRPGHIPVQVQSPGSNQMVECYACTGCPTARNATTKFCPYSYDHTKQSKCIVYAEKYHHMEKPWYIRGCASERGSCAELRNSREHHRDLVQLLFCKECDGDRCNDSNGANSRSTPDLAMAFVTMIFTPVLAKYTMS